MATCSRCGQNNPEIARFCLFCAAALTPQSAAPRDTRKTVTLVFADLVGSTALGDRLDPESLREVLGRYFDAMKVVLERHGGVVVTTASRRRAQTWPRAMPSLCLLTIGNNPVERQPARLSSSSSRSSTTAKDCTRASGTSVQPSSSGGSKRSRRKLPLPSQRASTRAGQTRGDLPDLDLHLRRLRAGAHRPERRGDRGHLRRRRHPPGLRLGRPGSSAQRLMYDNAERAKTILKNAGRDPNFVLGDQGEEEQHPRSLGRTAHDKTVHSISLHV